MEKSQNTLRNGEVNIAKSIIYIQIKREKKKRF